MADIIIYTTQTCPYCVRAKDLLKRKGCNDFKEIDVSDAAEREKMIALAGGRRTVPQIFINSTHVGGCDDLHALDKSGDLNKLLCA